jgi:hypothetical protein
MQAKHLLADATYKLTNEGYPVLTCGVTDKQRVFHPFGIALSFNEKSEDFAFLFGSIKEASRTLGIDFEPTILIADSAPAITNGFKEVFPLTHRGICWAHAKRGMDDIVPRNDADIRLQIVEMQASPTKEIFDKALQLFKLQYGKSHKKMCAELESWWFKPEHNTWYEGYIPGLPSTSNGIESFHLNGLKTKKKLVKRLPTMQFLDSMQGVMKDWSLNRAPDLLDKTGRLVQNPNLQIFSSKPSINEADFLAAYKWNQMNKEIRFLKSAGLHLVKAHKPDDAQDLAISTDECKSYLNSVEPSTAFTA